MYINNYNILFLHTYLRHIKAHIYLLTLVIQIIIELIFHIQLLTSQTNCT